MNTKDEEKKAVTFVQYRSTASVIGTGWGFLVDNLWSMLRLTWPALLVYALACGAFGLLNPEQTMSWTTGSVLHVLCLLAWLVFFLSTVIVLWQRHRLGTFPSGKAFAVLRDGRREGLRSLGRQLSLAVRRPRRWGLYLVVLLVGVFVSILLTLVGALPLSVSMAARYMAHVSAEMGDHALLPASMPWLGMAAGVFAGFIGAVSQWMVLVPLAFAAGRVREEEKEWSLRSE